MQISIKNFIILALMLASASLASVLRPTESMADKRTAIDLGAMVPSAFGDWRLLPSNTVHIIDPQMRATIDRIYSQTLTRTYVNSNGYQIMLSIAYGKNQSDALQLHKPEVCYPAQGFALVSKQASMLPLQTGQIPVTQIATRLGQRNEPVTYWTVVGDHITVGNLNKKVIEMRYAMDNLIPDGMLVRFSSIDDENSRAYDMQTQFAAQMVAAIAPEHRARFAGAVSFGLPASAAAR